MNPQEMLRMFAQYGVRKASMEDIARSAGVSRQYIYKRFGSKDGVFEWVLTAYIEDIVGRALGALKDRGEADAKEAVCNFFDHWSGEVVPIISNTEHGAEILDAGMRHAKSAGTDWECDVMLKLASFLVEAGLSDSMDLAVEQTNAMSMASKGIILNTETSREFREEMSRIVNVVFRP